MVAISNVRASESGLASAVLNVGRQLGGSLGIAAMGTLAAGVTKAQLMGVRPTHAIVDQALTGGFSAGFQVAGFIALVGFAAAFAAVRRSRTTMETTEAAEVVAA